MPKRELQDQTPAERRAAELLGLGLAALQEMGRAPGRDPADATRRLEKLAGHTASLSEVNQRLAPLLRAFQPPTAGNPWWRWFTGIQLEYEVQLAEVCKKVAALVDAGQQSHRALRTALEAMAGQYKVMRTELELLEADIDALRLLGSPEYLTERLTAGFGGMEKSRLLEALALLEEAAGRTRDIRAQFQAAIESSQPVADRYREIRSTLLPLWKRAVGFDLFVRGAGDTVMAVPHQRSFAQQEQA